MPSKIELLFAMLHMMLAMHGMTMPVMHSMILRSMMMHVVHV